MRSVLVLAHGDSARLEATLATAALAARRADARVDALHVRADADLLAFYAGETVPPGARLTRSAAFVVQGEAHARAAFDRLLGGESARATWRVESGSEAAILAGLGRVADLVVIGRADGVAPESVKSALFETGRPVLVAPPVAPATIGTRVAIAWNDSIQSARAVGAAMHLVARPSEVRVLVAGPVATEGLLRYLACWGIAATVEAIDPRSSSARARGRALLQRAQGMEADLLVMGAYGQGRMMQLLGLGGATAKVITGNTMPLLLAH